MIMHNLQLDIQQDTHADRPSVSHCWGRRENNSERQKTQIKERMKAGIKTGIMIFKIIDSNLPFYNMMPAYHLPLNKWWTGSKDEDRKNKTRWWRKMRWENMRKAKPDISEEKLRNRKKTKKREGRSKNGTNPGIKQPPYHHHTAPNPKLRCSILLNYSWRHSDNPGR